MSKLLKLSITIILIIINFSTLLLTSIVLADHLAPEVKTQVNQQSDLFEQSINDLQALKQQLMQGQQDNINSMGDGSQLPPALNSLTNKEELESKKSKLQAISEHDLEARGREELIKQNMMSLHPDYARPGYNRYLRDAEIIASAQDSLLSNLLGKLKELGIDCKTVKGEQRHEPEYYLQIRQQSVKDTVYNQVFCEQLRNSYSCHEHLTMRCAKQGIKWGAWQQQQIQVNEKELDPSFGDRVKEEITHLIKGSIGSWIYYTKIREWENSVQLGLKSFIINRLGLSQDMVGGYITVGYTKDEYLRPVISHLNYQFREGNPICLEWQEEWQEQCVIN